MRDGRDGRNGKDGAIGPRGFKGERGEKGEKGDRGERGSDGASVSVDDVLPFVRDAVVREVAAIPAPSVVVKESAPVPRMPWRLIPVRDPDTALIEYVDLIPIEM